MIPESETIISDTSLVASKPTESELAFEQLTTPRSLPIDNTKPSNTPHPQTLQLDSNEEKEILDTLQDLHECFVSLVTKVKNALEERVRRGELTIRTLTQFIQTYMHWENVEKLNVIEDLNELFTKLHRYFDFLECGLIVAITKEYIQGELATQLKQHKENALNLRRQQSIKNLKNGLRTFYTPHLQDTSNMPEVYIKLNDVWEEAVIEGLYLLVKCLLPKPKQQSLLEHIMIDNGSVLIKYRVEESYVDYLIAYAENKPQFMRLIGIFGLVINNIPILQVDENKNFTFDSALLESSQSGNNEAVQFLLDLGVNVNYSNSEGKTALMLACQAGHEEVVQTLVSAEANVNLQDSAGQTALMLADGNVGVVHRLLLAKADPNLQRKDGNTALHIACYERQSAIAELLLSFGATFVIPNTKGDTAFLGSVRGNNTEILKLMLNSIPHSPFIVSLGVVYACRFGHSAVFNLFAKQLEYTTQIANFFISCAEGDVGSVVQHIMEFNIDPNTTLISGITPLIIASSFGNADVLDCLLEAKADVNSNDQDSYSPLTYAITGNTSLHIVQCLLEAGANPNILAGGVAIVERAREKGEQTICDLLLKYSALHLYKRFIHLVDRIQEGIDTLINQRGIDTIFQITRKLEVNFYLTGLTSEVLTSIALLNQLTPYYDVLHFEMLVIIAREFLKDDIENELEEYQVMATKFEELVEIQKFKDILSLVPQQEVMSSTSCSELTFKLNRQWGNLTLKSLRRLYSYLLSDYQTYLSHMTVDVVEEVLRIKFLIPKLTQVVDLASEKTKKEKLLYLFGVIEIMLDDILVLTVNENKNFTFDSALLESSQCGNNETVQFLLDLGVNINYSNSEGKTALMLACQAGHEEVVQTLVSAEANVNLQDSAGQTALMLADGNVGVVHRLLLAKADPNLQRKDGNTALHIACYERQSAIAELLLSFGATFVIPNTKGDTAFLGSVRGNNTEILKLMLNSIPHSPFIVFLGVVYACRFGHSAVFNLFVKQLEYTTQIANFFISCAEGDVGSVVQHIMEFNIDPNTTLISGITPLMIASSFENADVLDCLLEAKADVNSTDQDGYSPLTYAITCNTSLHIVQCLLEAGANPNILAGGVTIVERAREKGEQTICDSLLKYSALHLYKRFIHLVDRIQEGIDTLIKGGEDILLQITEQLEANFHLTGLASTVQTSIDLFNQLTPYYDFLHFEMLVTIAREFLKGDFENELEEYHAMTTKFEELVEIQKFKDVLSLLPQQDVMSSTSCSELSFKLNRRWGNLTLKSLHRLYSYLSSDYQTYFSHMTVDVVEGVLRIKFLIPKLTQVVDLASEKTKKEKLLYLFGVIEIMLDDILVLTVNENKNFTFDSAFLESSQCGNNEAVQFLLDLGVNINYSNSEEKTALMLACEAGHEEVVQTLVLVGANVNFQDNIGQTALMVSKTKEIFSLLLQSNADINILAHNGSTPLIIASGLGHLSVVETLLVEYSNDPNFRNEIGMTALLFASGNGHYQVAEILLKNGADPNIHDIDGWTALLFASGNGHYHLAEILLKNGADPYIQSISGSTALILSSQNGHQQIVELLLEKQVDPNVQNSKIGRTALIQASQQGHYQVVEILLKNGADPNIHDNDGWTALIISSHNGHQQIVELLLEKQADPNVQNSKNGRTALIQASENGHYQVVEILLKKGADPNIHDNDGWTALILSSHNGHQQIVELLLEKQVDPNVQNSKNGRTALIQASQQGHYQVVEILLKNGADPNIHDNDGWTALIISSQNGHQQIVELLLEKQVDPNVQNSKNGRTALIQASENGHYQVVEILLKNGVDPNIRDNNGLTALLFASGNGHYHLAEILLKNGADPNIHDNDGWTALIISSQNGHQQIVELLLEKQVDPNVQNSKNGRTALIQASKNGHYQVVEILLKKGADPNIHDNDGWTALILSSHNGHQQIVELLLEKQVDPNVQNSKNGRTALIQASKNGHYQVVEILLKNGADPNIHSISGSTALTLSSENGHQQVVELLLEKQVDPNVQNSKNGRTALIQASQEGHYQVVEILLKKGADPNIHDNDGWTALILSSHNGHQQIVELLLEKQVDPNFQNSKNGRTALIQASQNGHYQVVEILLKNGADPNTHSISGSTALTLSSENGHQQVVELLLEKQVDPNVQNSKNGRTALIQASQEGHYQVVEILLKKGADPNIHDNDGWTALILSSHNGHQQIVELLLEKQVDPNFQNSKNGRTALIQASQNGHYQVVEILLKNGADPNIHSISGSTALTLSSENGHQQVVELLLEKQVDPNVQNSKNGRTALIQASQEGHYQVVEILLKKGADPNIHDNDGWTALILSSHNGHQQIVELLLEKQVDPNFQNSKNGRTALIQASQNGHYQVVEILLKNGADPNIHNNDGWTALILSSENGHQQIVELLLEKQADPNVQNSKNGRTALLLASQNGHYQVVEILLKNGADLEIGGRIDTVSIAAIHGNIRCLKIIEKHTKLSLKSLSMGWYYACCCGQVPIITFLSNRLDIDSDQTDLIVSCAEGDLGSVVDQLMSGKISPDVQFIHGVTPLMISSSCGCTDIVEALITAGVNVNKIDEYGDTALDYTEEAKQDKTRHLLLQHGGLHGIELAITSKTPEEPSGESNISTEEDISNLPSPDTTIFTRRKGKLNISSIIKYLEDSIDTHFTKHHSGYTKDPITRYTSNTNDLNTSILS